jgi:hypothetical protein
MPEFKLAKRFRLGQSTFWSSKSPVIVFLIRLWRRWKPLCVSLQCVFKGQLQLKPHAVLAGKLHAVERPYFDSCSHSDRAHFFFV